MTLLTSSELNALRSHLIKTRAGMSRCDEYVYDLRGVVVLDLSLSHFVRTLKQMTGQKQVDGQTDSSLLSISK